MKLSLEGLLSLLLSLLPPIPLPPWTPLSSVSGGPRGRLQGGWGVEHCPTLSALLMLEWEWMLLGWMGW